MDNIVVFSCNSISFRLYSNYYILAKQDKPVHNKQSTDNDLISKRFVLFGLIRIMKIFPVLCVILQGTLAIANSSVAETTVSL